MINVGVLGATGAVGQRFVQLLASHPWFHLQTLTASERSAGKPYGNVVNWRLDAPFPASIADTVVSPTTVEAVKDLDIVFSALPAEIAKDLEVAIAEAGVTVCSNASSHRMDPDVPLLIAEVNPDHAGLIDVQHDRGRDGCIVTNPNCSTIVLTSSLVPVVPLGISGVRVATLQAISGAGFDGIPGMTIFDNIVPYIGSEEEKMETEPQKILGTFNGAEIEAADLSISASCNRVPVIDGHMMSVWLDTNRSVEEVQSAFLNWKPPFTGLPTQPENLLHIFEQPDRPQTRLDRNLGNGMTVSVGRIREGIRYTAMGHNTIRGAAGSSVLNAELLKTKGYI
ncbi:MAG: aspartate-semialdehyde dehydrogenase [Methanocalculus sp. MSAO_Arc1]|uniref:aspartate-semialdehyde dehydrogenase n=1 Tax=Methanocalculus TaxID=71151 RepID=UPI000FED5D13|nr:MULTISPECIES: aspartate-semialdehyde dehydrogenase [unclassified Methanocalculus]MCP1661775.1 aspartate-semialdehyde dehydrogenase [Methanocalculus sp. AMF5]RQD79430.1 MAG: aspartate-semialdehyde dehydrogenase [Methanocalculus sp. MSAO_Arc1]